MKNTSKKTLLTRLFVCMGIIVGIVAIIFGILILTSEPDRYAVGISNSISFSDLGNDYYTYSYKAAKTTANNLEAVYDISRIIQQAFGYLLIISGLLAIVVFAIKFINNLNTNVPMETNGVGETQKELETLKQLFDAGAISKEEYENKKKEILGI